jgi:WXG100 family type VII secretion target
MADLIQADYQQLEQLASKFQSQSEAIRGMQQKLKSSMDPLKNGGWIGKGSDAFFNEMQDKILPAVQRLHDALGEASSKTKEIMQTMRQAEQDAASPFSSQR